MDKHELSVVIVSGKRLDALKLCLDTLRVVTTRPAEFVVVLCNETPELKEWVYREKSAWAHHDCPHALVVYNPRKNLDVYGCYNYGAEKAGGDVVCFINDDMVMAPRWDELAFEAVVNAGDAPALITGEVVEPAVVRVAETNHAFNCGTTPAEFDSAKFKEVAENIRKTETHPGRGWFMPVVVSRSAFMASGGYPTEPPFPNPNDAIFFQSIWPRRGGVLVRDSDMVAYHFQRLSQRGKKQLHWGHEYLDGFANVGEDISAAEVDAAAFLRRSLTEKYDYVLAVDMVDEFSPEELPYALEAILAALVPGGAVNLEFDDAIQKLRRFVDATDAERYVGDDRALGDIFGRGDAIKLCIWTSTALVEALEKAGFERVSVVKGQRKALKVVGFKPQEA